MRAERLLALKSNDFDKYREFVKEAKNERLTVLGSIAAPDQINLLVP